ncbi:MAG: transporter substrate-binding protein [Proteobacteria bacterium]|nr:transporter substrate-binding protein [Pseudomonadota bacterium]
MSIHVRKYTQSSWFRYALPVLLIGMAGLLFLSWNNRKPIRVGFVAQMTGKQAELGVQERNGVLLATEKINAAGGIAGRKIELVIRDDFGLPEKAKSADEELIKSDVVAIIGHATSGQTLAGLQISNPARVVMLAPTVSTPALSGLDDYFFRVYPTFKDSARAFAEHVYKTSGLKKMAIIYDTDNTAYAQTYSSTFSDRFSSLGGAISGQAGFSSATQPDFSPLLTTLHKDKPDGLLIIASDIDTALVAQRVRIMGWNIPLFTSAWAQTETLINHGGKAVDGMKLEQSFALSSQDPLFIEFKSNYQSRFGNTPSFGAAFGYEAAMVLAEALKKTGGKPDKLKNALLETGNYKGLIDSFSIDRFGDVQRPFYLSAIENGKFVIVGKLN